MARWCRSCSGGRPAREGPLPRILTLFGERPVVFFTYMNAIMLESALFIALLAVVGALFVTALGFTPFGRRIRQTANRKRIDRQADLTCPIHGLQREVDLVRLPTGEPLCSHCYKEAVHGHID
jgi:hypothetical protein